MAKIMNNNNYVVATIRPWNIDIYNKVISRYPGKWSLITHKEELKPQKLQKINPRYIFFPHWSHIVPKDIVNKFECVCFHETDLPYGRGGSPIQNLISRGHKETSITALKMDDGIDSGPIYLKRKISLDGLAEEIYIRNSKVVADMIYEIITKEPQPKKQSGKPVTFHRRKPEQSEIPKNCTMDELFNHLRMLDAEEYPRAFIKYGKFRLEFSRPSLKTKGIEADVRIMEMGK